MHLIILFLCINIYICMKQSTDNKVEYKDRDIYITPKADHS